MNAFHSRFARTLFVFIAALSMVLSMTFSAQADNGFPNPWHSLDARLASYSGSTLLDITNSLNSQILCSITNASCDKLKLVWDWTAMSGASFPYYYYVQFYTGSQWFLDTQRGYYDCQNGSWSQNGTIISLGYNNSAQITCSTSGFQSYVNYAVPVTQTHGLYTFTINVRMPGSPYTTLWSKSVYVQIK